MIEYIGWFGSICFSLCALPQVIKTYKTKSVDDLSMCFLTLWLLGEIASLVYVYYTSIHNDMLQLPLLANYVIILILLTILYVAQYISIGRI